MTGATRTVALDISKAFDRVGMLVFFISLSFIEFLVRYLALFHLFSLRNYFEWF